MPGNHELWTTDRSPGAAGDGRRSALSKRLVALARSFGVITPEDPYPMWPGSERRSHIVPLFTLYDYSFRPDDLPRRQVIDWAAAEGVA